MKDRKFLSDFSDELKLVVTYDEFNDKGENLITVKFDEEIIRLAREEEEEDSEADAKRISTEEEEGDESSEAEEIGIVHLNLNGEVQRMARKDGQQQGKKEGAAGDKEESEWQMVIKRVLRKYEKAEVAKEFNEEEFEQQMEKEIQEKMVSWKSDYYKVCATCFRALSRTLLIDDCYNRRNSSLIPSRNRKRLTTSPTATLRDSSGSYTTTTKVLRVGAGSTTTTTHQR